MATITTSTANSAFSMAFGYPTQTMMDVSPVTGDLWMVMRTTATQISIFKSTNRGASWSSQGSATIAGMHDLCAMRIDAIGENLHMLLFKNATNDQILYKRIPIASGTASLATGEVIITSGGNSTPQNLLYGADLVPIAHPDGTITLVVAVTRRGSESGPAIFAWTVKNDSVRTTVPTNEMFISTRWWYVSGDDSAITCNLDVEHNGDGITSSNPNIWLSWQTFTTIYCVKLTFRGYKTGWTTPSKPYAVATGRTAVRDILGRWDGSRYLITSLRPSDTTKTDVYERPLSNTGASIVRTTPAHPVGAVTAATIATNHVTRDFRFFAVSGTSTIRYVDYLRGSNTWTAWTQMSATAPTATQNGEFGAKRTTAGTAQYDAYQLTGASSPWTASNEVMAVQYVPFAPTWVTGGPNNVIYDGAAYDVTAALNLDWNFNDANSLDTQGSFALSRQIGAGTIQYWRTSDNTWQASEVQNSSAITDLTLSTAQWLGGGGAADPAHVYKVKTWDAAGLASAYSAGLSIIPSTRVDPNITAPTGSPALNSGTVGVTWTVTEQSVFRVQIIETGTGVVTYDSGFVAEPIPLTPSILSWTPPIMLPDGYSGAVWLTIRNIEGLQGVTDIENFTIDYVEPPAPIITALSANPALGGIDVTLTQPAAVGTQPATMRLDLFRRVALTTTPTNNNPYLEVNASDWTNNGYASVARSTAQFHQGVASLLLTPNGSNATPKAQTAIYPTVPGARWEWRGWLRSTTNNKTMRIYLEWCDAGGIPLSSTTRDVTPVANTWVYASMSGGAPPGTAGVRFIIGQLATPAAGDTLYADELVLIPANDDSGIRIGTELTSGAGLLDSRAVTGINYEYRGYALADNGTAVYGPWVA